MKVKYLFVIILLLIFAGCSYHQLSKQELEVKSPPKFLFSIDDPNNLTPDILERINSYNTILSSYDIPIFIIKYEDLPEGLKKDVNLSTIGKIYGLYITNTRDKTWPDKFIFINIDITPEEIITSIFHEYQHHLCNITQCYCSAPNTFPKDEQMIFTILKEKHAMENEFKESLRLEDPVLLLTCIRSVSNYILLGTNCTYKEASMSIYDGELWKEATDFLSNYQKGK